jgi:hypothetical protein
VGRRRVISRVRMAVAVIFFVVTAVVIIRGAHFALVLLVTHIVIVSHFEVK